MQKLVLITFIVLLVKFMLNKFYTLKTISILNCDPPFITPEAKLLLQEKNRLMHDGKIEHAGAVALKIGKLIAKYNSSRLSHIDPKSCTKDLWTEVRRLTKSSKVTKYPPQFSSQKLNAHFASISQDPQYVAPQRKGFELLPTKQITEMEVFYCLDKLNPTASGLDDLPAWFLCIASLIFSTPLTHLLNTSLASSTVPS